MFLRLLRKNALIALVCGLAIEAWIAIPGEAIIAASASRWITQAGNDVLGWVELAAAAIGGMLVNDLALFSLSKVARVVAAQFVHLPHAHFHLTGLELLAAKFIPPLRSAAFVLYGFQGAHLSRCLTFSLAGSLVWVLGYALLGHRFRGHISRFIQRLERRGRWVAAAEVVLTVASVLLVVYPL